jgi:hypothetical protein
MNRVYIKPYMKWIQLLDGTMVMPLIVDLILPTQLIKQATNTTIDRNIWTIKGAIQNDLTA